LRRGVPLDVQECEIFIPVTLFTKLKDISYLFTQPSVEIDPYSQLAPPKPPQNQADQNFNEIFEVDIPELVFVICREYKGEELVRLELNKLTLYFRTEKKIAPQIEQNALTVRDPRFIVRAGYILGQIGVNYFNLKYLKFEPFMDPWEFQIDYLKITE